MKSVIAALDDNIAQALLAELVFEHVDRASVGASEPGKDFAHALAEAFSLTPQRSYSSAGVVAREALTILADDPKESDALHTALFTTLRPEHEEKLKYGHDVAASVSILVAAIAVLQTRIRIERDKDGKWSFLFDKREASVAVLKPLAQKLIDFISHI